MSTVSLLFQQVLIMFLLAAVGYICFRTKKISLEGSRTLGNILIYLSLPCVIIKSFLVEYTPERLSGLLYSSLGAIVILLISILVSRLLFSKDAILCFASSFSNPGFFGIPLITATLSDDAVFYIAPFIALLNLMQWSYGVSLLTKTEQISWKSCLAIFKKLLTAPFMIAIIVGLVFFFSGLKMPVLFSRSIESIAALNTPLAMFTIGIYLAQTKLKEIFFKVRLYLLSAVRLLLIPAISLLVLSLFPDHLTEMKLALLIAIACPVGSNIAVYAQLHDHDYPYAVETVVISTLLSILTIPLIVQIAEMLIL